MTPKEYQRAALDTLRGFLAATRAGRLDVAFHDHQQRRPRQTYHPVTGLEEVPFVCLKVPTGGGKTLLAAASVPVLAEALDTDRPVVLWLAPTKTIRDQTLRALRTPGSPLRTLLRGAMPEPTVLGPAEALATGRAAYDGGPVVIVTTLASLRREETEGLKFYEQNGALMDAFTHLPDAAKEGLERRDGAVIPSLANLVRSRRPVIVTDEAHNARTPLAFQTYASLLPAAILELTATPKGLAKKPTDPPPSNVLVDVRAMELVNEGMIKFPIRVATQPKWEDALNSALQERERLEGIAREHGIPLNPILLIQCDPKNGALPLDEVRTHLIETLGYVPEAIAVGSGGSDLPRDLQTLASPVRIVMTVDQLKEGWDCPWAYVLLALRDQKAVVSIVQTLGRILRQPGATSTGVPDLDRGYVVARTERYSARLLAEGLVEEMQKLGFHRDDANRMTEVPERLPDLDVPTGEYGGLFETAVRPRPRPFAVPRLTLEFEGERVIAERDVFIGDVRLSLEDAELPGFDLDAAGDAAELVLLKSGRFNIHSLTAAALQQRLFAGASPGESDLVKYLDRHYDHPEVDIRESLGWLRRIVAGLVARGATVERLWGDRLRLRAAVQARYREIVREQFHRAAQGWLLPPPHDGLRVDDEEAFLHRFPERYDPPRLYDGMHTFENHVYPVVGEMDSTAEVEVATYLDALDEIEGWVRNVPKLPVSFWLPTSSDRFYPDFVYRLKGGPAVALEVKGAHLWEGAEEAREIGKIWAERSDGRCRFLMVRDDDPYRRERIRETLG